MTQDLLDRAVASVAAQTISSMDIDESESKMFRNCKRLMGTVHVLLTLGAMTGNPNNSVYAALHLGFLVGREVEQLEQLERMNQ